MEKLSFDQMESINGGIDWCYVAGGIAACGWVGLALGATTGGLGMAVICSCTVYAALFC